jgi:hypothetical protein
MRQSRVLYYSQVQFLGDFGGMAGGPCARFVTKLTVISARG